MNISILTWTNGQYVLNNYYNNCAFTYSFDNLNGLIKYFVEAYTPDKMLKDGGYNGIMSLDNFLFQKIANDVLMVSDYDCEILDDSDEELPEVTLLVKLNINNDLYALLINISYKDATENGIEYIDKDMYNSLLADKHHWNDDDYETFEALTNDKDLADFYKTFGPHIKLTIK